MFLLYYFYRHHQCSEKLFLQQLLSIITVSRPLYVYLISISKDLRYISFNVLELCLHQLLFSLLSHSSFLFLLLRFPETMSLSASTYKAGRTLDSNKSIYFQALQVLISGKYCVSRVLSNTMDFIVFFQWVHCERLASATKHLERAGDKA